jgi:hypothetical protein
LSTAKNAGARFSGKGFDTLIKRSCGDDALTSCVGVRSDLPPQLLEQLLAAASEKVRTKLMAEREYAKADIERAVDDVAGQIQAGAAGQPLSYAAAQVLVESLHQAGLLTTGKLQEFALAGRFEETVAALSVMSNVPTVVIEENMRDTRAEALLVLARANGLSWENNAEHHDARGQAPPALHDRNRSAGVFPAAAINGAADPRLPSHAATPCAQALDQRLCGDIEKRRAHLCVGADHLRIAAKVYLATSSWTNSLARSTFGPATMPLSSAKGAVGSYDDTAAGVVVVTVALVPPPKALV